MSFLKNLLLLGSIIWCFFVSAASASAMSFSAEFSNSEGQHGKIYMDSGKVRIETSEMISIMRPDKMLVWLLMPETKMYMEQALNPADPKNKPMPSNESAPGEIDRVFILKETVNGYASEKYKVTINDQGSHYEWISSDPGITMSVKTAAIDSSWWNEYRNINLVTPDPALFEIPSGYAKMSMPGMGGMPY